MESFVTFFRKPVLQWWRIWSFQWYRVSV